MCRGSQSHDVNIPLISDSMFGGNCLVAFVLSWLCAVVHNSGMCPYKLCNLCIKFDGVDVRVILTNVQGVIQELAF